MLKWADIFCYLFAVFLLAIFVQEEVTESIAVFFADGSVAAQSLNIDPDLCGLLQNSSAY